ncbi:MAG: glycosyltransferase family 4 protein [Candidatus Omnitrophica bacterium]|nr:glycosyltransferase family 4 protein [Candidatus Omnitrophota bacterium]
MKNILVFTTTFPTFLKKDGTPPFVYELSKRLAQKEDLNIVVLTPYRKGTKTFEQRDGLKIYRFKYGFTHLCEGGILPNLKNNKLLYFQVPFLFFFAFLNLKKIIKKEKINTIHAHWIVPQGFIAVFYKKIFRKRNFKIICTSHGGDIFGLQGWLMRKIKKWTLNNVDILTVVSNAIKEEVKKLKVRNDLPIKVIPMGVDDKLFNPDKYDPKIKGKYNIKGPFLIFVGRLVEKKGVKYLIEAMPEVVKKYPETKLLIIGSGPLEDGLKAQVKNLNLEKNIIFTGAIPNYELPKYYATADIFIGPSVITKGGDREGLPVTYLEAMASGCIVIGTDLLGNRDVIIDGVNGYFVRQKNSKDIVEKILASLYNKKINQKQVLSIIKNNFSWKIITNKYLEILK